MSQLAQLSEMRLFCCPECADSSPHSSNTKAAPVRTAYPLVAAREAGCRVSAHKAPNTPDRPGPGDRP